MTDTPKRVSDDKLKSYADETTGWADTPMEVDLYDRAATPASDVTVGTLFGLDVVLRWNYGREIPPHIRKLAMEWFNRHAAMDRPAITPDEEVARFIARSGTPTTKGEE